MLQQPTLQLLHELRLPGMAAAPDDRYGRRATLVTSQIPVEHWHEIVGFVTLAGGVTHTS